MVKVNQYKVSMKNISSLVGRILLSIIFLKSSYGKITNFEKMTISMDNHNIPFSSFFLVCVIMLLIIGGISVLTGFKPQLGAIALIIFLVPVTWIYHFDLESTKQMSQFYKNTAIIGGLLIMSTYGGGDYGMDGLLKRRKKIE